MLFLTIFYKVLFLVSISLLGFFLGRRTDVEAHSISKILLYIIAPIVIFFLVVTKDFTTKYLLISLGSFLVCSLFSLIALQVSKLVWTDKTSNLFAFTGGTGNTGYFGLPMVVYTLGQQAGAVAAFVILGVNLYEFTVGYFITSQNKQNLKGSLLKFLRLPIIYAFIFALFFSLLNVKPLPQIVDSFSIFTGSYSVLGMMVIGITLSKVTIKTIDWKFVILSNLWKYLTFPAAGLGIITLFDSQLSQLEKSVIMIMCCVPMAGNTVVLANELKVHPDKAAVAVMLSTILATFFLPLYLYVLKLI